jgi:hypothetical protein
MIINILAKWPEVCHLILELPGCFGHWNLEICQPELRTSEFLWDLVTAACMHFCCGSVGYTVQHSHLLGCYRQARGGGWWSQRKRLGSVWFKKCDKIHTVSHTKCTCPVLNAPRADTPFCLEYLPKGFSPRVDTWDKNGVFVLRAFKQGWCMCNFMKSGPSR